jgi:hypothetical protein
MLRIMQWRITAPCQAMRGKPPLTFFVSISCPRYLHATHTVPFMNGNEAQTSAQPTKAEVDRALAQKRLRRERRACYPCSLRKVRCDRMIPCRTCTQRGHPEICIPKDEPGSTSTRHRTSTLRTGLELDDPVARPSMRGHPDPHPLGLLTQRVQLFDPDSTGHDSDRPSSHAEDPGPTFVGEDSLPSFVHITSPDGEPTPRDNTRHTLGLQNTWTAYPYMRQRSPMAVAKEIDQLVPSHSEILQYEFLVDVAVPETLMLNRYSQCYQTIVYPFYPQVADPEKLESLICTYLERSSTRERSGEAMFPGPMTQTDVASTGLLLAILASGAHFSGQPSVERRRLSQEYGMYWCLTRRAFEG